MYVCRLSNPERGIKMSNHITIHGNVSQEPEMRVTTSGLNVLSFSVADSYGKDEKKKVTFHNITVFGQLAENVASSIKKGDSVIVTGRMETDEYTKKDGTKGKSTKVIADEVGFSMRWTVVMADQTSKTLATITKAFPDASIFTDDDF
jgi:single-strand DNA-binding protein